jgi:hypothetical protein
MMGSRLPDGTDWSSSINPGDYWKHSSGTWYAETPNGHLANLIRHTVTEHEDGSITVSPSILVSSPHNGKAGELWHGFLEHGVWRSC